jgi:hypothetical protein
MTARPETRLRYLDQATESVKTRRQAKRQTAKAGPVAGLADILGLTGERRLRSAAELADARKRIDKQRRKKRFLLAGLGAAFRRRLARFGMERRKPPMQPGSVESAPVVEAVSAQEP